MSVRGDAQMTVVPPPVPTAARVPSEVSVGEFDEDFYVEVHVVGVALRCPVDPQWPCEALLVAASEAYHAAFPLGEVPDCNVVFHRARQEFLVGGAPIGASCVSGDALELGRTISPEAGAARSSLGGRDSELTENENESEFCVLFHALPLGFTMKRGRDGNTEVGTIYPKSAATLFPRLTPGVSIVRIAGEPLAELGLRQVHDLIKHSGLPLAIHFLGPEPPSESSSATPEPAPVTEPPASCLPPPSVVTTPSPANRQQPRQRHGSFDRRSVRSSGSNGSSRSRGSRGSGRGKKGNNSKASSQHNGAANQRNGAAAHTKTPTARAQASESNQRGLEQPEDASGDATSLTTEAALLEQIESLKVALLRKHEEAKQIARQLELCTDKLVTLRASSGNASTPRGQHALNQQPRQNAGANAPRTRRAATTPSSSGSRVRLTPEVLEAMDSKAGLPRRGTGAYTSSNVSSVSGYSARSTPTPRAGGGGLRMPRSSRAIPDNVSVSSYTSQSSHTSGRGGSSRSPRGTALKNLNKRYNYMPQKYAASATGAPEASSTSLSSRGAVMSRARISRDSFISKTESPGVGYYDVKVRDRVKGGEIGDSDRSLPWS